MKYESELRELHDDGHWLLPCRNKAPEERWKHLQDQPTWDDIVRWDETHQPTMWGSITGARSGWWALDFDGENGEQVREELGLEPHTISPSGGSHVWFIHPGGRIRTLSAKTDRRWAELYPDVDVRGDGGQLIVLGGDDRGPYRRVRDIDPDPLEKLPSEMIELLTGQARLPARQRGSRRSVDIPMTIETRPPEEDANLAVLEHLVKGALVSAKTIGRNNAGFTLARALRDHGFPIEEAAVGLALFVEFVGELNMHGEAEPYTEAEAEASLRSAYTGEPDSHRAFTHPTISTTGLYTEIADEILDRLDEVNDPPTVFQRNGILVRVVRPPDRPPQIDPHHQASLRGDLMRLFDFAAADKDGDLTRTEVPEKAVADLLALPHLPGVPVLNGLLSAPTLRPDGSVLSEDGYDPTTALLLQTRGLEVPPVAEYPDRPAIERALEWILDDLLGDFAFADDPSEANALATFITPVIRAAIPGVTPLVAIDAPQARTGKTLLAELLGQLPTGYPTPIGVLPREDQELEKRVTAFLVAGDPVVAFDNVDRRIESGELAATITGPTWTGRELGKSRRLVLENRTLWVVTGNNIALGGDMAPRTLLVRLDARMDRPQDRDFHHDDLLAWAAEHRSDLLWALLTIARAGWINGPPKPTRPVKLAGFQPWATTCAGILEAVGVSGFAANRGQLEDIIDSQHEDWHAFLRRWRDLLGHDQVTVADLRHRLDAGHFGDDLPAQIIEAIESVSTIQTGRRLSAALMSHRDARYGGLYLQLCTKDRHTKTIRWRVASDGAS
jgi:hypothetical protein